MAWTFKIINDRYDEPSKVVFKYESPSFIVHLSSPDAARDWAMLPKNMFFEKYGAIVREQGLRNQGEIDD